MRKFLSSTAGATYNQELPGETICVRKDCVELIYKVQPSVNVIVSMLHIGDREAMLFVNWAHYFDRLQNFQSSESSAKLHLSNAESRMKVNEVNQQVQMPKIEKNCPTLYAVMTGDDPDGVYECDCRPDGTIYHGFSLKVAVPSKVAILECISPEIFSKAGSWPINA